MEISDINNLIAVIDDAKPSDSDVLQKCGEAIRFLLSQNKDFKEKLDDTSQLLHSYRHICGERTPEELNRLVTADSEGRCFILPFSVPSIVRNKKEGWNGTAEEISFNSDGMFIYVSSGGYHGFYSPDDLIVLKEGKKL